MNPISVATSKWGPSLGILICRLLPIKLLYRMAGRLASHLVRQESPMIQSLRRNMSVVQGLSETDPEVTSAVICLFRNMLCGYVDLFKTLSSRPERIATTCGFDSATIESLDRARAKGRGLLVVGAHTCAMDLFLLGLKTVIPSAQVLANANPQGASKTMNRIRAQQGLDITPISISSLRRAVKSLRNGGVVAIAADLPADGGEELVFFGRKSRLLIGHIRLALKTEAEIVVCTPFQLAQGHYRVQIKTVPRPASSGDPDQDMLRWAQGLLNTLEAFIRRRPDQWFMPKPVWPGRHPEVELRRDQVPAQAAPRVGLAAKGNLASRTWP